MSTNDFKKPTEAELFQKMLMPLVEQLGIQRTTTAMAAAQPVLNAMKSLLEIDSKQTAADALDVLRHFINTVYSFKQEEPHQ